MGNRPFLLKGCLRPPSSLSLLWICFWAPLNLILLWEWTWCHCISDVWQDCNVRAVVNSQENMCAIKKKAWLKCWYVFRSAVWCHVHSQSRIKFKLATFVEWNIKLGFCIETAVNFWIIDQKKYFCTHFLNILHIHYPTKVRGNAWALYILQTTGMSRIVFCVGCLTVCAEAG